MKVHLEEVSYAYRRTTILANINWEIGPGITGILGPNGAGKSTLLSLLATLQRPTSGRILLGDSDLNTIPGRKQRAVNLGWCHSASPSLRRCACTTQWPMPHGFMVCRTVNVIWRRNALLTRSDLTDGVETEYAPCPGVSANVLDWLRLWPTILG